MDRNQQRAFIVVAVPSKGRDIDEFRKEIHPTSRAFGAVVSDVTQLLDADMGDCFLVSTEFEQEGADANQLDEKQFDEDAEVWVTCNGHLPLAPPYGWKTDNFLCRDPSDSETICKHLNEYGLAIVKGHYDQNVYDRTIQDLKERVNVLENAVREYHPHIELGKTPFGFSEYTHRGPGRFELLLDEASETYQRLKEALEPQWIESVTSYLSTEAICLAISCVYSRPGSTDQEWHTDGAHLASDTPYAVCIFVPLIPLSQSTGYTRFWPKSHRYQHLLGLGQAADALQATLDGIIVECGDYVMYNYETWHKGTGNTSEQERPILQFLYHCDWYKERRNYGTQSVFDSYGDEQ